jgi:hypothetical protein
LASDTCLIFDKKRLKRFVTLFLFLAALSVMSGYLMSRATWIGKVGISLFHKEYEFLKTWWQGALIVFCGLLVVLILHAILHSYLKKISATIAFLVSLFLGVGGLYFSYSDFRSDLSHRLMGERFHLGVYIFWMGWITISLSYLFSKKAKAPDKPNSVSVSTPIRPIDPL